MAGNYSGVTDGRIVELETAQTIDAVDAVDKKDVVGKNALETGFAERSHGDYCNVLCADLSTRRLVNEEVGS
jgi:hypothetical protein